MSSIDGVHLQRKVHAIHGTVDFGRTCHIMLDRKDRELEMKRTNSGVKLIRGTQARLEYNLVNFPGRRIHSCAGLRLPAPLNTETEPNPWCMAAYTQ